MGPAEVVQLMDIIKPLVKGAPKEPNDKRRQIFEEHAHVPWITSLVVIRF
jgi:hypothetical protein